MRLLIKNGLVVNYDAAAKADVVVENDRIAQVHPHDGAENDIAPLTGSFDAIIDAKDCFVFPGFIDTHTHFGLELGYTQTADDFISGSMAALLGGTTTVLDFATQDRDGTLAKAFDKWMNRAKKSYCNYGFHMALSRWDELTRNELGAITDMGVTSYKLYMAYDKLRLSDEELLGAIVAAWEQGAVCGVHCEDWAAICKNITQFQRAGHNSPVYHALSRPAKTEADAVKRLIGLAAIANAPCYVVHLSTKEGLDVVTEAVRRGREVYAETCPQYLLLTDKCYDRPDGLNYIMSPPLRSDEDKAALWHAAATGGVDFIGTDHCSFNMTQKARGRNAFWLAPNGIAGVGDRARLIYTHGVLTGKITLCRMVELLSHRAAELFGMPSYGYVGKGYHADIVVWNPAFNTVINATNHFHSCDNSAYTGLSAAGKAQYVVLNGRIAIADGNITGEAKGSYIKRKPLAECGFRTNNDGR